MTMEIISPSEELINTVFLSGHVVNYLTNIYSHRFLCLQPWSEKLLIMIGIDKCRNMILVKVLTVSSCVCSALHGTLIITIVFPKVQRTWPKMGWKEGKSQG